MLFQKIRRTNRMKIVIAALLLLPLVFAGRGLAQDSLLEEFGTTDGQAVDNGFVFLDGQYLQPPYVISRKGLTLYVNDAAIEPSDVLRTKKSLSKEADYAVWTQANKARLLAKIENVRADYETNVQKGACYFFFSEGGHISMQPYSVAYELPRIVEDLRSGRPIDEKLQSIRRMNWHLHVGDQKVAKLVARFSAPGDLETRLNRLAKDLLRVRDFGTTAGKPIEKGFVFYNGRYIDAPYAVVRRGLGIFIDDALICRPTQWPRPSLAQENDPNLPEWITQNSAFEDVRDHLVRKYHYLIPHYSEKEAITKYVEHIRNLPCVKDLKFTTESSIEVTTFSGEVWPIELSSSFLRRTQRMKYDKNSVLQRTEAKRKYYEDGLLRGDCFFIFDGGEITLPVSAVVERLPDVVQILRSPKTTAEKFEEFQKLSLPISKESFPTLVTDFYASQQLEGRLSELTKPK